MDVDGQNGDFAIKSPASGSNINSFKYFNVNNSAKPKNFNSLKNCFQHTTVHYSVIQLKLDTIHFNNAKELRNLFISVSTN